MYKCYFAERILTLCKEPPFFFLKVAFCIPSPLMFLFSSFTFSLSLHFYNHLVFSHWLFFLLLFSPAFIFTFFIDLSWCLLLSLLYLLLSLPYLLFSLLYFLLSLLPPSLYTLPSLSTLPPSLSILQSYFQNLLNF